MKTLPLIAALGLVLLAGCSKNSSGPPPNPTTSQGWIDLAWSQYESGDFLGSGNSITSAFLVTHDDSLAAYLDSAGAVHNNDSLLLVDATARLVLARFHLVEILSAAGWLNTRVGAPITGNANFTEAIAIDSTYVEAYGGNAFALQAMDAENWVLSNEMVVATLTLDSAWVFAHDQQINYLDLRLLRAENYFNMGDFSTCLTEALSLNAIVNPGSPLGPEDFNLATVEGRAALAQLLNNLDELI